MDPGHRELLPAVNMAILRWGPGEGKVGSALGASEADHPRGGGKDLENGCGSGRRGRETQV